MNPAQFKYDLREGREVAFELYTDVSLARDLADYGLRVGDVGTVVERHLAPGGVEEGYSVEFFDVNGNTAAVVTVPASALRHAQESGSDSDER